MYYGAAYELPKRPPEDYIYWIGLGLAQTSVVVLALLRRRGLR